MFTWASQVARGTVASSSVASMMLASSSVPLAPRNAEVGLSDFVDGRCRRTLSELYDSALERVKVVDFPF